ncbi:allantoicase [Mortierella sp. GBAus27b]|nr:Allantoicase [Mortierella sp. GBA43]KAI8362505.1 allantoicase [Mortierella sp. GBAus27b]
MTAAAAPTNTVLPVEKVAETFKNYIDLAVATRGGKVLTCSDEWFADASNLLTATAPIHAPGRFVPTGAWYDGWETRRHNAPNFDWSVIQLGYAGTVAGFEIDTSYFTGNHAPFVSVEGFTETNPGKTRTHEEWAAVEWAPILTKVPLNPGSRHAFKLDQPTSQFYTHVRFCMYPDGGVARLRVYGSVHQVRPANKNEIYDLASAATGSVVTDLSDAHYGHPSNMLLPGRGHDMSDGWETKRSRAPGHVDFATIKLGEAGHVTDIEVDTAHYMGNPPKTVTIEGFEAGSDVPVTLLEQAPMTPHRQHFFKVDSNLTQKSFDRIKVIMIPDGGIKRIRVWGAAQLPAVKPEGSLVGVRQELPDEHTWNKKN